LDYIKYIIWGAVIDQPQLPISEGLVAKAIQGSGNKVSLPKDRHNDGYFWHGFSQLEKSG
jgi:hypothetical protein